MNKQPRLQLLTSNPENPRGQIMPAAYADLFEEQDKDELDSARLFGIFKRRAAISIGVAAAVFLSVVAWTFTRTPMYEGKFQVLVEPVTGDGQLNDLTEIPGAQALSQESALDYSTQIQVLKSSELMSPIITQLQGRYPNISYDSLISSNRLSINRLQDTKILEVRYRDSEPDKIEFVLDQVAKNYLRYSLKERQLELGQGKQFVDSQLDDLRQRVTKSQEDLQAFRQRYNLLDPDQQVKDLSTQVSDVTERRLNTQVELVETQKGYADLQEKLGLPPGVAIAAGTLTDSPSYKAVLGQLSEVEGEIARQSAVFRENTPKIQILNSKRERLRQLLAQEAQRALAGNAASTNVNPLGLSPLSNIKLDLTKQLVEMATTIQMLNVRYQALTRAEAFLKQKGRELTAIARQYNDLQRESSIATESLNRFLNVRETLQIEAAQNAVPWQLILAPSKPLSPFSPNIPRNLMMGVVASVLLGLGAALLAERLDNVFHSPEELRDRFKLPLLGVIPYKRELEDPEEEDEAEEFLESGSSSSRYNRYQSASPFLEAFRSLHTNIRFLSSDAPIQAIVISSAVPAEGKSTVAVHLAQAAAAMGQQVLLVDADLRRPQIHAALDLPNLRGLSTVLTNSISLKEVVEQVPDCPNLYVLAAGQPPPDPTRLLSSRKMQTLMEQFHSVFDLVIYDTPPLLGFADARLLTAHADGVMLVVGLGKTERNALLQAIDNLKVSCATTLGLIANGVKGYTTNSYDYYERYYSQKRTGESSTPEAVSARM